MSAFLRKYGAGTGADIFIPMVKRGLVDFAVGADWTPAAGDCKVSKDGAAAANIGTLPVAVAMGNTAMWKFVLADAELQCKTLAVFIADSATKVVEDNAFDVETYGNASALHPFDLATASTAQTGDNYVRIGAPAGASVSADAAAIKAVLPAALVSGRIDASVGAMSAAAVQAIWDALTSALTTAGSIGKWILDKLDVVVSTRATPAQVNTEADTALSDAGVTSARMGYTDNLNIGGPVASSAEAVAIQNNTRVVRVVPDVIERPDSGTTTYRVELLLYDDIGNMEAPDSAPTIALVNQAGTDRSSRLDSVTMALISTGRYRAIYTAAAADALEQLVWTFSVIEGGATRIYGNQSLIVDTSAVDFTAADRTKLDTLHDTRIPGVIQPQTGDSFARIGAAGAGLTALGDTRVANLDAAVSSRLATAGYTAPPTVGQVADQVWDEALAGHVGAGSAGLALGSASAPSAAAVADAVWDEALAGHAGVGSAGAGLSAAGSAGDPWSTALPGAYVAGTAGYIIGNNAGAGAGAITWPYTVTSSVTGLPIADVDVWVTSDLAGLNVLASGRTAQSGVVTFFLDAGTVFVFRQKSSWNFDNPDESVVA